MSLAKSMLRARETDSDSGWNRIERRFHRKQAVVQEIRRMGLVVSYADDLLCDRVTGSLSKGRMAGVFGSVLSAELEQPHWPSRHVANESTATVACILHLDGVDLSDRARAMLGRRLREARQPDDMPLYPMLRGLCGIYFGFDDIWQAEADVPWSDAYVFVSGRTFGGNVKGLMAYLGAARLNAASFDDVEPALLNFIELYDGLRDAGFVYFEHLVLVCIIAGSCIGGVPRERTLDWVGRYICWAVGLDEDKPALPTADGLS